MNVYEWEIENEARDRPTDGPWREAELTGFSWGRCSCGYRAEGSDGAPLPSEEVKALMSEHSAGHPVTA